MIREMAYKTIHNDMIREIKTNKKAIKNCPFYCFFLLFNCLLWSFKLYKVNLNKRPTKLWCLTQHGLVPLCQGFEVPISKKYLICLKS